MLSEIEQRNRREKIAPELEYKSGVRDRGEEKER